MKMVNGQDVEGGIDLEARQNISDLETAVGNEELTTTAQTVTGAVNEVKQANSELSAETNLLTGVAVVVGEYVNKDTGATASSASFTRTDFVPIDASKSYVYLRGLYTGSVGCFFTSAKTYIGGSAITVNGRIAIPATAAYMMVNFSTSFGAFAACSIRYVNIGNLYEKSYSEQLVYNPHKGVTAAFLGDSLTKATGIAHPYHAVVKDALGIGHVNNLGIDGTSISASNGVNAANAFTTRITSVHLFTDLVVVFGGTNDYNGSTPMGTLSDVTDVSFYGALRVLCEGLINRFLIGKIVFVTPIHRSVETANSAEKTLVDYSNAIKEVCALYGLPVIDGFTLGINSLSAFATAYFADGVHLNQDGHYVFGKNLASRLMSI